MIDVSKLTEQQVEMAAQTLFFTEYGGLEPPKMSDQARMRFSAMARAAASSLQLPIEPPSEAEIDVLYVVFLQSKGDAKDSVGAACRELIRRRNAAKFPKPDPRREKLIAAFNLARGSSDLVTANKTWADTCADIAIAALDEVK